MPAFIIRHVASAESKSSTAYLLGSSEGERTQTKRLKRPEGRETGKDRKARSLNFKSRKREEVDRIEGGFRGGEGEGGTDNVDSLPS